MMGEEEEAKFYDSQNEEQIEIPADEIVGSIKNASQIFRNL